jgi:hypothetical protein
VLERGPDAYQSSDAELLALASSERRAVATRNIRDVALLHTMWAGQERSHAGIVLVHGKSIPEGDRGGEIRALDRLLRERQGPDDLADTVVWLQPSG